MLQRHDYVTPYIDGIRFFDKPPLMYWMAAGSMHLFGIHDWAARLPLALGSSLCSSPSTRSASASSLPSRPRHAPDRGGFYAALALATSIGPYLYTRFYIPDILLALWMTLAVHLFLIALDRIRDNRSAFRPCPAFAAVMALNVLTKGLIGLVFPIGFVLLYLALTRQLRLLARPSPPRQHRSSSSPSPRPGTSSPRSAPQPSPLPAGLGLPAHGGWAWFYLYNEHIARFLSAASRTTTARFPIPLFWLLSCALDHALDRLPLPCHRRPHPRASPPRRPSPHASMKPRSPSCSGLPSSSASSPSPAGRSTTTFPRCPRSLSSPPASRPRRFTALATIQPPPAPASLRWTLWFLVPLTTAHRRCLRILRHHRAAPRTRHRHRLPARGQARVLQPLPRPPLRPHRSRHGTLPRPLAAVAISMLAIGLGSYALRRRDRHFAANLILAAAMTVTLLAAHEGLARFYPILGSKDLALAINRRPRFEPTDLIILDGELTSGSSLLLHPPAGSPHQRQRQRPLVRQLLARLPTHLRDRRLPPPLWASPRRIFLFTYNPTARTRDLTPFGPVHTLASAGGKTVLTNH